MEENVNGFRQTHFVNQHQNVGFQANPRDRGKSCSHLLLKFFVIALFLSVIPLFPSDPPEFISQTVFAKSWELIHLLIIGILLSYGLFCRPKTAQTPPKTRVSQPFAANILHHSSIFDYEEGNPSGVCDEIAIPTKSFDLSHYGKEPFSDSRIEKCISFDERPLGLPIRSLRSRVPDSDSEEAEDNEEEEEEEEYASECESDLSGENTSNVSRSEKDENMGRNEGNFTPILGKSKSMRNDYYMAENGKFEPKQVKFQSFRSPQQETSRRGSLANERESSSCQRVSGFCSWLPQSPNMMGREDSLRGNNFYMPFTNFTSVNNDFNLVGLSPNLQNPSAKFFMPSTNVQPSVPFSAGDYGSSYITYNHENEQWSNPQFVNMNTSAENSGFFMPGSYNYEAENWGRSPYMQNDGIGGWNHNSFMPTVAFPPSMPSSDDFAPSVRTSENERVNQGSSPKVNTEIRSEVNSDVPEVKFQEVVYPPIPHSTNIFSTGSSPKQKNEDSNGENLNPEVLSPVNEFAVLRGAKFKHGSFAQKDEGKSMQNNVAREKLNPLGFSTVYESAVSQGAKFKYGSVLQKNEDKPEQKNEARENLNPPVSPVNEFVVSRDAKIKNGPFVQKHEEKSEQNNVAREDVKPSVISPANEFAASQGANLKHDPSLQKDEEKAEKSNVDGEKLNPSGFASVEKFDASRGTKFKHEISVQKDEEKSTPKVVVSPEKNEQRAIPERWDDDCFMIPLSENNDMDDELVQENPVVELSDSSSESPSSARSSNGMRFNEQNSAHKEEAEEVIVQGNAPKLSLETEDLAAENESYKPSTPSPPPQIQTRRNNLSIELSSRFLGNQSVITNNNNNQGSPPTLERRKALLKTSHSRRFSCGPFFDRELRKSFKDEAKEANRKTKEDHQFARGSKCGCLMLDVKPTFNRAALKGKSVRTIRPKQISSDQPKNDHSQQKHEENNAGERKGDSEMVFIKIGITEKGSSSHARKGDKVQGSGETSILVGLNARQNSSGTTVVPIVHELKEDENDSEIDKKADEFIAKFKEQIRLQKVTSRGESSRHKKPLYHT